MTNNHGNNYARIDTYNGCPTPHFYGLNGVLYAGNRRLGSYVVTEPRRYLGTSDDGKHTLSGRSLEVIAQSFWFIEQGKGG